MRTLTAFLIIWCGTAGLVDCLHRLQPPTIAPPDTAVTRTQP